MGAKLSLARVKKLLSQNNMPDINADNIDVSAMTTLTSSTATFNGDVYFNGNVYGLTPSVITGVSGELSASVHNTTITASGTSYADATNLPTGSYIYHCTSTSNTHGVRLQDGHKKVGLCFIVINDDATNHGLKLYPTTNGKIDNAGVNSALDIQQGKSVMLICFDDGASPKWGAIGY